jgi:hypothetical protein
MADGQTLVVVSAATTMGVEALNMVLANGKWETRTLIGGAIVFTSLAGVAEIAPQPAGMFAVLIMVTVLIKDGGNVISAILPSGPTPTTTPTKRG